MVLVLGFGLNLKRNVEDFTMLGRIESPLIFLDEWMDGWMKILQVTETLSDE